MDPQTMKKAATVETMVWVLIYGGLLGLCLSVFVSREDTLLGTVIAIAGSVATALGAVLVVVRSRMK
jgi:hypothetical protein